MMPRFPHLLFVRRAPAIAALALLAVACSDGTTEPPPLTVTGEITVDASAAPAFVALGEPPSQVTVADPSASSAWDLAFFATQVTVNGGAAGPGGVTAYCLCANAGASTAQLQAMTPANQLAAFDAITGAAIPLASQFVADVLNPAISGWYTGAGAAAIVTPSRSWIIRRTSGGVILGKFRVVSFAATATGAASITVETAIQPAAGAPFAAAVTRTLDLGTGPVYFDLAAGQVSSGAAWDLRFHGLEIRVNGGVSGTGGVSAVVDQSTPFAQITAAYASFAPAVAYRADSYGGVFASAPWYRYNITGTDNQIWPTFNVYLVRRGDAVYKVQITGYYNATGTPRQITIRSARLR